MTIKATGHDLLNSRELALETASAITAHPGSPDRVLANYGPIEDFLLAGDLTDYDDLRARRKAIRQHLANLRTVAAAGTGLCMDDPAWFVAAAWRYYDRLMPGPREAR